MKQKYCAKGNHEKNILDFHKNITAKDGLQSYCKTCRSTESKKTYDPIRSKKYQKDNAEKIRERRKIYHQNNKEKNLQRQKVWAKNNPEKIKAHKKKYADKHPGEDIKRLKNFVEQNPSRKNIGRKELRSKYVAWVMTRRHPRLKPSDIPDELIQTKQTQLKILRQLREN